MSRLPIQLLGYSTLDDPLIKSISVVFFHIQSAMSLTSEYIVQVASREMKGIRSLSVNKESSLQCMRSNWLVSTC